MKKLLVLALAFIFLSFSSFGQNQYGSAALAQRDTIITGASAQTTLNNNILLSSSGAAWIDTRTLGPLPYKSVEISILVASGTVTAGIITLQESPDNGTTVYPLNLVDVATNQLNSNLAAFTVVASTPRHLVGNINARYIRVFLSVGITGTTSGVQAITTYRPVYASMPTSIAVSNNSASQLKTESSATTTSTPNPASVFFLNSAATTNATNLKAATCNVFNIHVFNATASVKYLRLYNKASAPTVGTDVPLYEFAIPVSGHTDIPINDIGLKFSTGLSFAITGAIAVLDNTAVAAGDVQLTLTWQ